MTASLPGFESPAVGFDQPFEMLEACHDRVRRSLALLGKLVAYLSDHPHDAQSRSAAHDVLRYFELAAPLHHQDEEAHVFPSLSSAADGTDSALKAAVVRLRADHAQMESLWAELRPVLQVWASDAAGAAPDERARRLAAAFAGLYDEHLVVEETLVFPAARARIDEAGQIAMSHDMAHRRKTAAPR